MNRIEIRIYFVPTWKIAQSRFPRSFILCNVETQNYEFKRENFTQHNNSVRFLPMAKQGPRQ